ncbi:protein regulator of cytokinesis 1-like isoform X2 [Panonychus citri]|uniref:protein regulator of cytokinesis 1-like isoform X2 n=1 Tax=Panonychus citri TaxID=50023 RepID=UPI0023071720|nr:protein regulator of cytokinesis 1-like isoform X2 [Panonychus citri]
MPSTSRNDKRKTLNNFARINMGNGFHDEIIEENCDFKEHESETEDREKLIEFIRCNRREENSTIDDDSNLGQLVMEKSQEVVDKFMETMSSVAEKWAYLGLSRVCLEKRLDSILNMVVDLYTDAEKWEDELVRYLMQEKDIMEKNLRNLSKDLNLPDYEPPQGGRFMDMLNDIMVRHEELQFIKKERVTKWSEFLNQKLSLCKTLGLSEEMPRLSNSFIPSENDIQGLQSSVMELKKTYNKRQKVYIVNKKSILQLATELEMDRDCRDIVKFTGHEETSVILSESFIKEQESYMCHLQEEYDANEKRKIMLEERLNQLWDKLEIDVYTRRQELNGIVGWKPSELEKLKQLVDKYEEIKKQNMGKFIDKLRCEIREYWKKIYASPEEEEEFDIYMCEEDCTEALLTAHEDELARLKGRYHENRELFESLDTWLECWVKYLDLEKKMNDPNRFNNRGGVLLKQEKEKKRTQKELTKCEKDIRLLSEKWSIDNFGAPFLVGGQPVLEFIECQKNHHQVIKENEKKERLKTKNDYDTKSRKLQLTNSKPTPNLLHRTPTKQSVNNTPASGVKSSCDMQRRLQTSTKPLSPVNRELRSTRPRTQVQRLGVENRCNSSDRRRATPGGGSIKTTPSIPTIVYGGVAKSVGLDQLIDEDRFRALLQDRKHETLESTGLSKKSRDNSPVNQTLRDNHSKIVPSSGYGTLNRRKSRSYTVLSLKNVGDFDEPLYRPTSPKLTRWGSAQSVKSNKSLRNGVFSPRPPFRP